MSEINILLSKLQILLRGVRLDVGLRREFCDFVIGVACGRILVLL